MITIPKKIEVTTGQAPFVYQWTSSNACLTFSKPTGTTSKLIETDFILATAACNATVTLTVTSACGNTQTFNVAYTNPCNAVTLNPIVEKDLLFSVTSSSPGCSTGTFTWSYDTTIFEVVSNTSTIFSSGLQLKLKATTINKTNTSISVTYKDCNGCEVTAVYSYQFIIPVVQPITVNLYPVTTNGVTNYVATNVALQLPPNTQPLTTLFTLPKDMTITFVNYPGYYEYNFSIPASIVDTISSINTDPAYNTGSYIVKSTQGIWSNKGNVTFVYNLNKVEAITVANKTITLPCEASAGQSLDIEITDCVTLASGYSLKLDSFTIQGTSLSPSITSKAQNNKLFMVYTIPTPIASDVVRFTLSTTTGEISKTATFTIVPCSPAPTANNDTFTIAANSTVTKDILVNDNGNGVNLDPTTVEVSNVQSGLQVTTNPNGSVTITVLKEATGSRTFTYTVKNVSGRISNSATVTVTVVNAGQNTNVILCD